MQMLNRAAQVRRIRGGVTTRDDEFGLEGKGDKRMGEGRWECVIGINGGGSGKTLYQGDSRCNIEKNQMRLHM